VIEQEVVSQPNTEAYANPKAEPITVNINVIFMYDFNKSTHPPTNKKSRVIGAWLANMGIKISR